MPFLGQSLTRKPFRTVPPRRPGLSAGLGVEWLQTSASPTSFRRDKAFWSLCLQLQPSRVAMLCSLHGRNPHDFVYRSHHCPSRVRNKHSTMCIGLQMRRIPRQLYLRDRALPVLLMIRVRHTGNTLLLLLQMIMFPTKRVRFYFYTTAFSIKALCPKELASFSEQVVALVTQDMITLSAISGMCV